MLNFTRSIIPWKATKYWQTYIFERCLEACVSGLTINRSVVRFSHKTVHFRTQFSILKQVTIFKWFGLRRSNDPTNRQLVVAPEKKTLNYCLHKILFYKQIAFTLMNAIEYTVFYLYKIPLNLTKPICSNSLH